MSFKPTLTRRDFLKSTSTGIGSLCTLSAASQVSPLIAKPAELTTSLMAKAISVHIPLWHQGQLDSHKFWNEIFQDLSAHKIQHCFLLNYHFVDPVMGRISKRSQFNNNQAPELSFLADGMKLAQERGIKASLYPVLEIDNPHQIGGIWRGNLNFFGRTLETFFQQYMRLIDDILDITATDEQLGKTAGKDLAAQKATYPSLWGLEKSQAEAEKLVAEALEQLESYGEAAEPLRAIAKFIVTRNH